MKADFLSDLQALVRFPSISTDARYASGLRACATWLARHMQQLGLDGVRLFETARHPIVYAEKLVSRRRPTLLIYGHYDVQPTEPAAAWTVPPFAGLIRGNKLYGRGASDDKGQFFVHLKALELLLQTGQPLPLNVKILLEGEEEIGSPNLAEFVQAHRHRLRADWALLSDTNLLSAAQPALTYGLRGSLAAELTVTGPRAELHSGIFGGAVLNPLQALSTLLAALHDEAGRIAIPGFYDPVQPASVAERAYLQRYGPSDAQLRREAQVEQGWGEAGYSLYERTVLRPSLSITGLTGGYQGAGVQSIVPARASAKLSFRLAQGQNPHQVEEQLRRFLRRITPPQVQATLTAQLHAPPYTVPPQLPVMQAAAQAYAHGFGRAPVLQRSGGTIPVVSLFEQHLGIPTVLMGFGLPDDRKHGPDEFLYLPNFWRGIRTSLFFLRRLGQLTPYSAPLCSSSTATATPAKATA
ncbi:dipeptidase [Hymenobacter chitinivorans]|uniref:Acetylornithine deacetylase/succinyl-diaminopimelate desuccinylase-like protein n=1 Tax=Hymenobacter chitinivorans DSM 11115 TaxID=1121954 RepID=A0A2M9BQD6_9BACT|nr:dipeptidase [Hymenobacter chitinivorans]PJJ60174.1 acetylornithine deacetylase/succinyl-diaminopimelate desuccinylase-like protein [Hymenobacter chitinivorans DSM 11115]